MIDNYPDEHEGSQFVGITRPGSPVYYDEEDHALRQGAAGDEDLSGGWTAEERLDANESLGESLERVHEESGWNRVTEFAKEHLPDGLVDSDEDSGENSD